MEREEQQTIMEGYTNKKIPVSFVWPFKKQGYLGSPKIWSPNDPKYGEIVRGSVPITKFRVNPAFREMEGDKLVIGFYKGNILGEMEEGSMDLYAERNDINFAQAGKIDFVPLRHYGTSVHGVEPSERQPIDSKTFKRIPNTNIGHIFGFDKEEEIPIEGTWRKKRVFVDYNMWTDEYGQPISTFETNSNVRSKAAWWAKIHSETDSITFSFSYTYERTGEYYSETHSLGYYTMKKENLRRYIYGELSEVHIEFI